MENCIFCEIARGEAPSWKVYEDEHTYVFLDIHPATEYHTLVIPKKHYENIFDVPEDEAAHVMRTIKKTAALYQEKLGIENAQVINSSGAQAQQDVFHLHFHIVPRAIGDGQDVQWTTHPEWREKFDGWLERLAGHPDLEARE